MVNHAQEPLFVVVLAAGKGTRMKSALPKVLHTLAGKPMIGHVLDSATYLKPQGLFVVCGHGADKLSTWAAQDNRDISWVEQKEQLGTGHAIKVALPTLEAAGVPDSARILIVSGDVPLTKPSTLEGLVSKDGDFSLLTVDVSNPFGYGRIVRDSQGSVVGVVEEKDASDEQRQIKEINTNVMCISMSLLKKLVPLIDNNNAQQEYYLPDLIGLCVKDGRTIEIQPAQEEWEVQGVNDRLQLEGLERIYQRVQAQTYMAAGLAMADASRFDVRGSFKFGQDCRVDINVVIEGNVELGDNVTIGQNVRLKNVKIGSNSTIHNFSDLEDAVIGEFCQAGPFARVRPGTVLGEGAKLGNFVETKNATLDAGAKINHLSYAGDCAIGQNANIGAGTIFCNYDGVNKHQSTVGAGAFIGSNSSLISPVIVGAGATVGAGSTITRDVPEETLVVARGRAKTIEGWKRPTKK